MPTVSVIIPCFNASGFLAETIESVFNQTYADFELIVVDDGSTDNSRAIIETFGARLKSHFGPNRGASHARNIGTQLASGMFLQYLDADDLLTPDALLRRLKTLQGTGADVAYSDWQRFVENECGFKLGDVVARKMESVHPDPEIATLTDFWCPPAALLYRREIVDRIGKWSEDLPIIQDARFLIDAALRGAKFVHVPGIGAYYRMHRHSLSRNTRAFLRDCLENATQVEGFWRNNGGLTEGRAGAVLQVLSYVTRSTFESDRETFERALSLARRLHPGWIPTGSRYFRLFSSVVGYPRSESCAVFYRKLRRRLAGSTVSAPMPN